MQSGFTRPTVEEVQALAERYSSFNELCFKDVVLQSIAAFGFERPTPVQAGAIPVLLNGGDLICQAPAGTGKTGAFSFPMLNMVDTTSPELQALVVVPTNPLAKQHHETLRQYGGAVPGIRIGRAIGEDQFIDTVNGLKLHRPHILVATMGRLLALLQRERPVLFLDSLRMLVVDEVDTMLGEESFRGNMQFLIRQCVPPKAQIACFSATYRRDTLEICRQICSQENSMELLLPELGSSVGEFYVDLMTDPNSWEEEYDWKYATMVDLCDRFSAGQIMIFFNRRDRADEAFIRTQRDTQVSDRMVYQEFTTDFEEFHHNRKRILLATDSKGRGIDVPSLSVVILFDIAEFEVYRQRIGRCGRMKHGTAITICTPRQVRGTGRASIVSFIEEHGRKIAILPENLTSLPGYGVGQQEGGYRRAEIKPEAAPALPAFPDLAYSHRESPIYQPQPALINRRLEDDPWVDPMHLDSPNETEISPARAKPVRVLDQKEITELEKTKDNILQTLDALKVSFPISAPFRLGCNYLKSPVLNDTSTYIRFM